MGLSGIDTGMEKIQAKFASSIVDQEIFTAGIQNLKTNLKAVVGLIPDIKEAFSLLLTGLVGKGENIDKNDAPGDMIAKLTQLSMQSTATLLLNETIKMSFAKLQTA